MRILPESGVVDQCGNNRRTKTTDPRLGKSIMRLFSTNTRKHFLAVMLAFLALAAAGTAFADGFWTDSPASVSGWDVLTDFNGSGTVELYTSLGQYAFPLDAPGAQMLQDVRDAKKSGHAIFVRLDNVKKQYCYWIPNTNIPAICKSRAWGISQVQ
jgi:hypothetical protein